MKTLQKRIALLLAALLFVSVCTFGVSAEEPVQKAAIITAGSLNVRAQPDDTSERIGGLTEGKAVTVIGTTTENGKTWHKIIYGDTVGYILGAYALLAKDVGMVTVGAVNVRVSPSAESERVGGLALGSGVEIFDEVTNGAEVWYRTAYNGSSAYVLASAIGIMKLPASDVSADYKKTVSANVVGQNIPKNYKMVVDGKTFTSEGETSLSADIKLGQLTGSRNISVKVYDKDDRLKAECTARVTVKNDFGTRFAAFFRFIFSGFRWGDQTVEIR